MPVPHRLTTAAPAPGTPPPSPAGAPRNPRTLARDLRRQQVIEATITTIAARGHARTTLTDVARAAGISHGLVLFHFGSKENLLAETLGFMAEEYQQNWQAALAAAGPDPADRMLAMIAADFTPAICTPARLAAWCAFWGEAQSRPIYQQMCGDRDRRHMHQMEDLCAALNARHAGTPGALSPVHAARILRLVVEGTWLDMMTLAGPYDVDEARRTVMATLSLCFPAAFAPDGTRR